MSDFMWSSWEAQLPLFSVYAVTIKFMTLQSCSVLVWMFLYLICSPECLPPSLYQCSVLMHSHRSNTSISGKDAYSVIREWGKQEGKGTNVDLGEHLSMCTDTCSTVCISFFPALAQLLILISEEVWGWSQNFKFGKIQSVSMYCLLNLSLCVRIHKQK